MEDTSPRMHSVGYSPVKLCWGAGEGRSISMMAAPVVQWICRELSRLLGVETNEDVARYILAMESKKDVAEYMYELLDKSQPKNRRFVDELLERWKPPGRQVSIPMDATIYKKSNDDMDYVTGSDKGKHKKKDTKQKQNREKDNDIQKVSEQMNGITLKPAAKTSTAAQSKTTDVRKKSKFVPLFGDDGSTVASKLPGRHLCECQASKHALINNCVKCGRVVCDQEGSGPCLFCGNLVCSKEEQEFINRGTRKSEKLLNTLMHKGGSVGDALQKAVEHKEKLLHFDKTSVKRTKVIDDESDYFSVDDKWLSKSDREKLRKREEELRDQRHASRKDRKITLDFAGRKVVQTDEIVDVYNMNDAVVQDVHYGAKTRESEKPNFTEEDFASLINPNIVQSAPQFVPNGPSNKGTQPTVRSDDNKKKSLRIQDKELKEMSDEGMCMSMHQPWASLLVAGIKRHEGRTWYTAHRGRLWIAATVKTPTPEEIAAVEQQYTSLYNDPDISFPETYPTGCLLGCVDVMECLSHEEYQQKFEGDDESSSPYVFICENPHELVLKFPMKGKHKIYKLEGTVHQGAKKGIRKVTNVPMKKR